MIVSNPQSAELSLLRDELLERVGRLRRRIRVQIVVEGLLALVAAALVLALLSYGVDRWLRLGPISRLVLLGGGTLALLGIIWRTLARPLAGRLETLDLVAAVDRVAHRGRDREQITPRVATVLQLSEAQHGSAAPAEAVVQAAVVRAYEAIRPLRFDRALDATRARWSRISLALLVAVCGLPAVFPSDVTRLWIARWFLGSNQPWPQRTYLRVADLEDGRIFVPRGEPYVLRVSAASGSVVPETVSLRYRAPDGQTSSAAMTAFAPNDFRYTLPSPHTPLEVTLRGGDDRLGPFTIEPVDRPSIAGLELTAEHPRDAGPRTHKFAGHDEAPSYLPRTDLTLTIISDVPLRRMNVRSAEESLAAPRRIDDHRYSVSWRHEHSVQMFIELIGADTGLVSRPTPVAVGLKKDRPPRVTLRCTGVGQFITPVATIPATVSARDDYGVAAMKLVVRIETPAASGGEPDNEFAIALPAKDEVHLPKVRERTHNLALAEIAPPPGALVYLTGNARDACYLGAQSSNSRTRAYRVVAPEELFRRMLLRLQTERARFRKALSEAERIHATLTRGAAPDFTALLRQHRSVQRRVWRVSRTMDAIVTEMRWNALGSPESFALLDRNVLEPLTALHDDPMSRQQQTLSELQREAVAESLHAARTMQETIVQRMRAVLQAMAQWDSFVDVLNQLEEVIRIQGEVGRATKELRRKLLDSIFDK